MGVYGVNWVRIGCMRCRDDRLGGRAESWTDLCHPAFAMAGALAWQVKKISIKKVTCFGLEWRQHGSFLAQGLSSGVWCAVLSLLCCLFLLYCSHTHLKSDSAQQRQRHISPPKGIDCERCYDVFLDRMLNGSYVILLPWAAATFKIWKLYTHSMALTLSPIGGGTKESSLICFRLEMS